MEKALQSAFLRLDKDLEDEAFRPADGKLNTQLLTIALSGLLSITLDLFRLRATEMKYSRPGVSNLFRPRAAPESRAGMSNRRSQGRMWPPAYIYVALKGITNKMVLHTYMKYSGKSTF